MWPMLLDMSKIECRGILRRLELEAYGNLINAFRAQGGINEKKQDILKNVRGILHISNDRHRAEVRRATNDEVLYTVAEQISGPNSSSDWSREGRRLVPLIPRGTAHTTFSAVADSIVKGALEGNAILPRPSETRNANEIDYNKVLKDHPNIVMIDLESKPDFKEHTRKRRRSISEDNRKHVPHQRRPPQSHGNTKVKQIYNAHNKSKHGKHNLNASGQQIKQHTNTTSKLKTNRSSPFQHRLQKASIPLQQNNNIRHGSESTNADKYNPNVKTVIPVVSQPISNVIHSYASTAEPIVKKIETLSDEIFRDGNSEKRNYLKKPDVTETTDQLMFIENSIHKIPESSSTIEIDESAKLYQNAFIKNIQTQMQNKLGTELNIPNAVDRNNSAHIKNKCAPPYIGAQVQTPEIKSTTDVCTTTESLTSKPVATFKLPTTPPIKVNIINQKKIIAQNPSQNNRKVIMVSNSSLQTSLSSLNSKTITTNAGPSRTDLVSAFNNAAIPTAVVSISNQNTTSSLSYQDIYSANIPSCGTKVRPKMVAISTKINTRPTGTFLTPGITKLTLRPAAPFRGQIAKANVKLVPISSRSKIMSKPMLNPMSTTKITQISQAINSSTNQSNLLSLNNVNLTQSINRPLSLQNIDVSKSTQKVQSFSTTHKNITNTGSKTNFIFVQKGGPRGKGNVTLSKGGMEISGKIIMAPRSVNPKVIQQIGLSEQGNVGGEPPPVTQTSNSGNVIVLGVTNHQNKEHSMLAEILQAPGTLPVCSSSQLMITNPSENKNKTCENLITEDTPVDIATNANGDTIKNKDTSLTNDTKKYVSKNYVNKTIIQNANAFKYINKQNDFKVSTSQTNNKLLHLNNFLLNDQKLVKPITSEMVNTETDWEMELENTNISLVDNNVNIVSSQPSKNKSEISVHTNSAINIRLGGGKTPNLNSNHQRITALDNAVNMLGQSDNNETRALLSHLQNDSSFRNENVKVEEISTQDINHSVIEENIGINKESTSSELIRILNDPLPNSKIKKNSSGKIDIFSTALASADINLDAFDYYQDDVSDNKYSSNTPNNLINSDENISCNIEDEMDMVHSENLISEDNLEEVPDSSSYYQQLINKDSIIKFDQDNTLGVENNIERNASEMYARSQSFLFDMPVLNDNNMDSDRKNLEHQLEELLKNQTPQDHLQSYLDSEEIIMNQAVQEINR